MAFIKNRKHGRIFVDIPAILKHYERIKLVNQLHFAGSGNAQASCPSAEHDDSDPSWGINIQTGAHHCFGCGWSGETISLIRELESIRQSKTISYDRAIEKALAISSSEQVGDTIPAVVRQRAVESKQFKYYPDSILNSLVDRYDYLVQRGVHPSTCISWEVRYSDKDERYVLPVRNIKNSIVGFIGIADDHQREAGLDKVLYSPGLLISKLLYGINRYEICPKKWLILVEGAIDCLRVASVAGREIAVMAVLHSTLTHDQAQLIKEIGYDRIIVLSDNDKGGDRLWQGISDRLEEFVKLYRPKYDALDPGAMSDSQIDEVLTSSGAIRVS